MIALYKLWRFFGSSRWTSLINTLKGNKPNIFGSYSFGEILYSKRVIEECDYS